MITPNFLASRPKLFLLILIATVIISCYFLLWNLFPSAQESAHIECSRNVRNEVHSESSNKHFYVDHRDLYRKWINDGTLENLIETSELTYFAKLPFHNVKYLSTLLDISQFKRRVYIDGGANRYESSIGGWFLPKYPGASDHPFEIHAFEPNPNYASDYENKPLTLHRKGLWIRDEVLQFSTNLDTGSKFTQFANQEREKSETVNIPAVNFSKWLEDNVSYSDYVVVKLDVEGAEFEIIDKLVEDGTINLIDELFLECHFDFFITVRKNKTRQDCLNLWKKARKAGVYAHEWF